MAETQIELLTETQKQKDAFLAYYITRNLTGVCRDLGGNRSTMHKWKKQFRWDERCEERDREVAAFVMPQWIDARDRIITRLIDLINDAENNNNLKIHNMGELIAAIRALQSLLGESEKVEIVANVQHQLADDPEIVAMENTLLKLVAAKEQDV